MASSWHAENDTRRKALKAALAAMKIDAHVIEDPTRMGPLCTYKSIVFEEAKEEEFAEFDLRMSWILMDNKEALEIRKVLREGINQDDMVVDR